MKIKTTAGLILLLVPLYTVLAENVNKQNITPRIDTKVTQTEEKQYKYEFTIINASIPNASGAIEDGSKPTSPYFCEFSVPINNKDNINNIYCPVGWRYTLMDNLGQNLNWQWNEGQKLRQRNRSKNQSLQNQNINRARLKKYENPNYILKFYTIDDKYGIGSLEKRVGFGFCSNLKPGPSPCKINWKGGQRSGFMYLETIDIPAD